MTITNTTSLSTSASKDRYSTAKSSLLCTTSLGLVLALGSPAIAQTQICTTGAGGTIDSAVECGMDAEAIAEDSIAVGDSAKAGDSLSDEGAIAIGGDQDDNDFGARATVSGSIAIGADSSATSTDAIAIGRKAETESPYGVALGSNSKSQGTGATAIGESARALESKALALGSGAVSAHADAVAVQ